MNTKEEDILNSSTFQDIKLRENATLSYKSDIIDGFIDAIRSRFQLDGNDCEVRVIESTKLLHLKNWPLPSSNSFKGLLPVIIEMKNFGGFFF